MCNIFLSLGTFSTVYKALDLKHFKFNNASWHKGNYSTILDAKDKQDELHLLELYARSPGAFSHLTEVPLESTSIWRSLFRKSMDQLKEMNCKPVFVALKNINPTSSPDRVLDEISFISDVRYLLKHFYS